MKSFIDEHGLNLAETYSMLFITICQIILVIGSIIKIKKYESNSYDRDPLHTPIKICYFIVITLGLLTLIIADFAGITGALQLPQKYLGNNSLFTYCEIICVTANVSLITYLTAIYMFYLCRIFTTFECTQFAVSKRTFHFIRLITIIIYILSICSIIYFHFIQPDRVEVDAFCDGNWILPETIYIKVGFQIIIVFSNMFYGCFFYDLLSQFLFFTKNCSGLLEDRKKKQLKSLFLLIHKQTTLVFVCTVSSLITWSVSNVLYWFSFTSFVQFWVYFDILINCICIWFMFSFNDKHYDRYCGFCRFCNDKSVFQFSYNDTLRMIKQYPSESEMSDAKRMRKKVKRKRVKRGSVNNPDTVVSGPSAGQCVPMMNTEEDILVYEELHEDGQHISSTRQATYGSFMGDQLEDSIELFDAKT